MENNKKMKRFFVILCVIFPMLTLAQVSEGGGKVFGFVEGTINVSMYGGATYYLPIDIPQGVNDMQPSLGIVYNSQSGNGLLGYGWNLSGISTISRTGSTLYHNGKMTEADFSDDDCFLLDGQRLVLVAHSGNTYDYKTENDEFSRIRFTKENGYFSKCEVRLENGNIIKYGYTNDSKLMASDGNNVIKWMVSSIADRNGNTISYFYNNNTSSDISIKKIAYTSNAQANLDASYVVSFTYSDNRFDDYHYYIAGNKVNSNKILTNIDISYYEVTLSSYSFSYDGNTNRMYNLLTGITYSKGNYSLDPIVIQWNTDSNDIQNNALSSQVLDTATLNKFSFVGDFNGDGYTDLLTVPYKKLYGYSTDVTAKVYLNNQNGSFNSIPNDSLSLSLNLDWIHVLDINGDGYDDLVAQTITETLDGNDIIYHTGLTVYESQNGNGFSNEFSTVLDGSYFIRTGDFLGEGRSSLILLKLTGVNANNDNYMINGYPSILHYDNNYTLNTFSNNIIDIGAVIADDFNGDGKTEIVVFDSSYSTFYSFDKQNNSYSVSITSADFDNDLYASYYSGDFNNDGKADVLFNDESNDKYIALSNGFEFGDWIRVNNSALQNIYLPSMMTYKHSLHNVSPNSSYGVSLSDIDGDGKTDIIFYDGNNLPMFFRDFHVTNTTTNVGSFKIVFQANSEDIKFENQYFTIGNFFGEDHASFIAVDPQNQGSTTDDIVKIFSLPSTNERFSVSSITDMLGRSTTIEYEYLMPGQSDFYVFVNRPYLNDVKPCPMPMLAMKSYTKHLGLNNYKTSFKYGNALLHRTGRGFVNFENVEKTSFINNTPVKLEKCVFELTTMGANAVALPQCDSTFLFLNGIKTLSETNAYTFQNVRCNRQQTSTGFMYIVRPAMTSQKTKHFNPDSQGQLLSVEITEYTYDYQNNGTYTETYACTDIVKGANGTDCNSAANCGYKNNTHITFISNNYSNWIINRKSSETTVAQYQSKPAITRKASYQYASNHPFQISQKTVIPSSIDINPLSVRYNYQYDVCGNVTSETVSAPYGTQNELPLTTSYTYSSYRLVASKTVDPSGLAYQECYSYDNYDRMTSYTGSNGLITTYQYYDPFNNYVVKTAPDNTITAERLAWATGSNLAPTGAIYYKQTTKTGSSATTVYFDANGNTLRAVTLNHTSTPVFVDTEYDERQQPERQSFPYIFGDTPQWTEYFYDDCGRIISTIYPDGKSVSVGYHGFTTATTTSVGNSTRQEEQTINYLGWVTTLTDASNAVVSYEYYSAKWRR